jgi:AcrR family transcriptional regulator
MTRSTNQDRRSGKGSVTGTKNADGVVRGDGVTASRGRYGGRPSRRDDLLNAAVDLFATGGTRSTTLEAIAQQIGVTRAAITHHFKTKEALLQEVGAISDRLDNAVVTPTEPVSGMAHLNLLRSWAHVVKTDERLANLARLGVVMTVEAFDPQYAARKNRIDRYQSFRDIVATTIRLGQDDGSIRTDVDPDLIGAEVIGFMEGIGIQWYLDADRIDIEAIYGGYFDRLSLSLSPTLLEDGTGRRRTSKSDQGRVSVTKTR